MVDNVQAHLQSLAHPNHGLETLAIIYSLPYTLLMWGMIFSVLAFFTEFFQHSSVVPSVPVSVMALTVLVLVGWSWHTLRDSPECGHLSRSVLAAVQWVRDSLRWILASVMRLVPAPR
ncbi:hypothetical protein BDR04DRAFT_1101467 [Suillus decipiens]|nr:hypothetical protein BDR04DRAFT_1101467 [Suillus decipiens]